MQVLAAFASHTKIQPQTRHDTILPSHHHLYDNDDDLLYLLLMLHPLFPSYRHRQRQAGQLSPPSPTPKFHVSLWPPPSPRPGPRRPEAAASRGTQAGRAHHQGCQFGTLHWVLLSVPLSVRHVLACREACGDALSSAGAETLKEPGHQHAHHALPVILAWRLRVPLSLHATVELCPLSQPRHHPPSLPSLPPSLPSPRPPHRTRPSSTSPCPPPPPPPSSACPFPPPSLTNPPPCVCSA